MGARTCMAFWSAECATETLNKKPYPPPPNTHTHTLLSHSSASHLTHTRTQELFSRCQIHIFQHQWEGACPHHLCHIQCLIRTLEGGPFLWVCDLITSSWSKANIRVDHANQSIMALGAWRDEVKSIFP
jgi:hypothetical protein